MGEHIVDKLRAFRELQFDLLLQEVQANLVKVVGSKHDWQLDSCPLILFLLLIPLSQFSQICLSIFEHL